MLISLTLRPVNVHDKDFLYQLYVTTREREMAFTDWDDSQKEIFLRQQFDSQKSHYRERFPQAKHDIILLNEQPAGRIYVNRSQDEIRLLDITLHPQHRNQGIGTSLMDDLLAEAQSDQLPIRLYVWQLNDAAQHWYERLGFKQIDTIQVYHHLEWQPSPE